MNALDVSKELDRYQAMLDEVEAQFGPLQEERDRLRGLIAVLSGERVSRGGRKPAASAGVKRLDPGDLIAAIGENPGQNASTYAETLGMSKQSIRNHLATLTKAGQIQREGERADTKYFPA